MREASAVLTLTIPLKLKSAANLREKWQVRHRRVKAEREQVRMAWFATPPGKRVYVRLDDALTVTFVRVAPRPLDDDNLAFACKGLRDQIADTLGLPNDRDPRVQWRYEQRRGKPGEYAVEVRIEAARGAGRKEGAT